VDASQVDEILRYLKVTSQDKNACELAWAEIESVLLHKIAPLFWQPFVKLPVEEKEAFGVFHSAIQKLHESLATFEPTISTLNVLQPGAPDRFKSLAQGVLLARAPYNHQQLVKMFFDLSFKVFCHSDDGHDDSAEGLFCQGCNQEVDQCVCKKILNMFGDVNR